MKYRASREQVFRMQKRLVFRRRKQRQENSQVRKLFQRRFAANQDSAKRVKQALHTALHTRTSSREFARAISEHIDAVRECLTALQSLLFTRWFDATNLPKFAQDVMEAAMQVRDRTHMHITVLMIRVGELEYLLASGLA